MRWQSAGYPRFVFCVAAGMAPYAKMDGVSITGDRGGVYLSEKRTAGQKHGNLRSALLQEALKLLDIHGVEGVTIRAVARNAGVAHSSPANHFPSRRAILTALAASIFADFAELVTTAIAGRSSQPVEAIPAFAESCFHFAFETPNRYQLIWQRDLVDQNDPVLKREMDRVYAALLALLGQARNSRRVDVETDAIAIWSMIHGYISLRLSGNFVVAEDCVTNLPRQQAILLSLIDGLMD